jgi:hypothetical protein
MLAFVLLSTLSMNATESEQDCKKYALKAAREEWGTGFINTFRMLANPGAFQSIENYYHDLCVGSNAEGIEILDPIFL